MKIFWQYPVKTELIFYKQNNQNKDYLGFPWATIIDKKMDLDTIERVLKARIANGKSFYTCCQHIYFRILIPMFKNLNINTVYTPHKIKHEDSIEGITIKPCPLYAVNVEDDNRNKVFRGVDLLNKHRSLLYAFQGAYQDIYLSNIRLEIFNLTKTKDNYIRNTGQWHFNETVYSSNQSSEGIVDESNFHVQNTENYNIILINSKFSLCPSGSGPSSIRFWESLAVGTIPILLSDTLDLPQHVDWKNAIIRFPEKDISKLDGFLRGISEEEISMRRLNCMVIYNYFKNDFKNSKYDLKSI